MGQSVAPNRACVCFAAAGQPVRFCVLSRLAWEGERLACTVLCRMWSLSSSIARPLLRIRMSTVPSSAAWATSTWRRLGTEAPLLAAERNGVGRQTGLPTSQAHAVERRRLVNVSIFRIRPCPSGATFSSRLGCIVVAPPSPVGGVGLPKPASLGGLGMQLRVPAHRVGGRRCRGGASGRPSLSGCSLLSIQTRDGHEGKSALGRGRFLQQDYSPPSLGLHLTQGC
ncbi:hypothetical protein GQ53DRAFT_408702 [Thozetella sp. PMI_491]|nr:hypothetical protein GQ53DRAFT_408702 [Thozetella sp. PMI_491]